MKKKEALLLVLLMSVSSIVVSQVQSDSAFLAMVQRASFDYFWTESNSANGLTRDRSQSGSPCSIAANGFGLTSICVAVDNGWISREAARDRVLTTLKTFWNGPQGFSQTGMMGMRGFFYHFLKMDTGVREWSCELSSIDTALLLGGVIYVKEYFTGTDSAETQIRNLSDSIYFRIDWDWMRNYEPSLTMGYKPEAGFLPYRWIGYNEAMLLYILALGSQTHPVDAAAWSAWTSGYQWQTHYSYSFVNFPPLFGHQYSHCWIDFRNIWDDYMSAKGISYFDNSRRATLANRAYCIANPLGKGGYGENVWGLTASDGPDGYAARGAPPGENDDGTISPTAAGGSIAFAPNECISALRYMYTNYPNAWGKYGFKDGFNPSRGWYGSDWLGIDQGPFVLMIENYRNGNVWKLFTQNKHIQAGLRKAGFLPINNVEDVAAGIPVRCEIIRNFPNPFNPSTTFRFTVAAANHISLKIYDLIGREVSVVVNGFHPAGVYDARWNASDFPSGIYIARMIAGNSISTQKVILAK